MATASNLRQLLQRLGGCADIHSDADLLARFRAGDESAFAALVERHGAMVLATCRRVIGSEHDAEDAFQATFLILARNAGSLDGSRTLAAWLHTVAQRVSLDARKRSARRRRHEQQALAEGAESPAEVAARQEASHMIDAELTRLPLKYRAPLVLCFLEGKTHEQAAHVLGWPRGSMAKRLARGQEILKQRLVRRGLSLAVATALLDSWSESRAAVATDLVVITTQAAQAFVAGPRAPTTSAELLATGVMRNMFVNKCKKWCLVCLLALGAVGVGLWWNQAQADDPAKPPQPVGATAKEEPQAPLADVKKTVAGGNQFACDLFGRLREQPGNIFMSPYSISTALAMTSAGARGETDAEMVKVLHLIGAQEQRHPAFAELIRLTRREQGKGVQLHVANALWGQEGFRFRESFINTTDRNYGAGMRRVDFKQTEAARQTINRWVEQNTNDKIKDLIPKDVLDPYLTRLVLTNAIYFKGDWASQFKKEQTQPAPFTLADGKKVEAKLMTQTREFKYFGDKDLQALELPYVGNNLSMLVLLPRKKDGLNELEAKLDAVKLEALVGKLGKSKVMVQLPRFKTRSKFELNKTLPAMGMPLPFDATKADLHGMHEENAKLYISNVIHEGFVEVNEEGTEAAGATAVVIKDRGIAADMAYFRADHPFLFLIRDHTTGSILFLGRMADPTK